MQTYLAHELPTNIGYLLIIAVALWGAYKMLISYCERQPFEDDLRDTPARQREVASEHVSKILAGMPSLRTNLRDHKNPTVPSTDPVEVAMGLHYGEGK